MNASFVILLGLLASAHCWPFSGVTFTVKEHLAEDIIQWKDQLEKDAKLIQKHMMENIKAVMSGDPYEAIKTLTKNYIELAKVMAGQAMNNSFKIAHDLKEDVEKIIEEYNSNPTSETEVPVESETGATIKPEIEDPVGSKTDVSDETETEAPKESDTMTSDKSESEISDESETKPSEETKTDTSDETNTETSDDSETKALDEQGNVTSDEPENEDADEWGTDARR